MQAETITIFDEGKMFDKKQENSLENWGKTFSSVNRMDVNIITISSLENKSLRDSSFQWVDKIQLNHTPVNHAILIFLVAREQKVDIHLGIGLEWFIDDERINLVKRKMINQFKYGNFITGIQEGCALIREFKEAESFEMDIKQYENLRETQHLASNRNVSFPVTAVTKNFPLKKLSEEQFSSRYFIYVHAPDNQLVKLHFSRTAYFLIIRFLEKGSGTIYGRVRNTNPLDIDLYGIM
jgi:uncharacterized membrane protein YgcG